MSDMNKYFELRDAVGEFAKLCPLAYLRTDSTGVIEIAQAFGKIMGIYLELKKEEE